MDFYEVGRGYTRWERRGVSEGKDQRHGTMMTGGRHVVWSI